VTPTLARDAGRLVEAAFELRRARQQVATTRLVAVSPPVAPTDASPARLGAGRRTWASVDLAARWLAPGSTCLMRALAAHAMLQRRGVASAIRVGVGRETSAIHAHAWIEIDGQALDTKAAALVPFGEALIPAV